MHVYCFDDNPYDLTHVKKQLEESSLYTNFKVTGFTSYKEYQKALTKNISPDVAILDIHVQQEQFNAGIFLAEETRQLYPHCVIIMRSSFDDAKTILKCLHSGADEFISKTSSEQELALRILHTCKIKSLLTPNTAGGMTNPKTASHLFASETLNVIAARIPNIIASAINAVHVFGETGTGKEVVANLFAENLGPHLPFVRVNCGAIAQSLLESELFGHVKGAFTGALQDKRGLIEEADGGWIFLDEVASLSPAAQVSLLRVLENGELRPVGSNKNKKVNVRILSASNESLEDLVSAGKFRQDLLQRLTDTKMTLPPLRERPQDIIPIAKFMSANLPNGPYRITEPTLEILSSLSWRKGNVRELRNCIRAMTEYSVGKLLTPIAIPKNIWQTLAEDGEPISHSEKNSQSHAHPLRQQSLTIQWQDGSEANFEDLVDKLLAAVIDQVTAERPRLSLRALSAHIGLARTTLSERIKRLADKNLLSKERLAKILGN